MQIKKIKFQPFDLDEIKEDTKVDSRMISLWLPEEVKKRFDQLQSKSNKKFGKYLKEVVIESINNVKMKD